ncbi:MAG: Holliday junction branch migration protein RuvA [Spirochaetaceae bacterium]
MINSLTGMITATGPDYVRLQTAGVEWHLEASGTAVQRLGGLRGEVRVPVYLYHREDTMRLYGFADEQERRVFIEMLSVSGIGPRQALRILTGVTAREFQELLEREDVRGLSSLPGLGKKTAEKMVFTLKGRLVTASPEQREPAGDIVRALCDMGFDERSATDAVRSILTSDDLPEESEAKESEVLKRAIVRLS